MTTWQLENQNGLHTSGWMCTDGSKVGLFIHLETNSFELRPFSKSNLSWIVLDREDFTFYADKISIESGASFDEWCFKIADYICGILRCEWQEELMEAVNEN